MRQGINIVTVVVIGAVVPVVIVTNCRIEHKWDDEGTHLHLFVTFTSSY